MGIKQIIKRQAKGEDKTFKAILTVYTLIGEAADKGYGTLYVNLSNIHEDQPCLVSKERQQELYNYDAEEVVNHFLSTEIKVVTHELRNLIAMSLTWDSTKRETLIHMLRIDKYYPLEEYFPEEELS